MNDYEQIGIDAYEIAEQIFKDCNADFDFCHQTGLIFGGRNRIKLTPQGWCANRSYCTMQFLQHFDKLQGQK